MAQAVYIIDESKYTYCLILSAYQ